MRNVPVVIVVTWSLATGAAFAQGPGDEGLDSLLSEGASQGEQEAKPADSGKERPTAPEEDPEAPEEAPAAAAEAPPPADVAPVRRVPRQVVEEIVVTARKVEENLQDVPVSVTAITAEGLRETSIFEMKDLGFLVPNVTTTPGPGQSTAVRFQIRGQIQNDVLGTLDPSVGFYDDGIYVARPHGANAMFFDVKNLQVLRGPQGTLFGRNTTGGAILLATNDPDFEGISGSVGAGLGSFERRVLNGVLNAPILEDVLAVRLAAQSVRSDGFAFDAFNDRKVGTEGTDLLRAKLLYQPFEGLSFLLKGQQLDVDFLGTPVKPLFALEPQQVNQPGVCCLLKLNNQIEIASGGPDYDDFVGGTLDRVHYDEGLEPVNQVTVRDLALTTVWDQPWATLKFIGGYRENDDVANRIDIDGSPSVGVDTLQANGNRQQSYELQLTGTWLTDRLSWAAGAYYFTEDGKERMTTEVFLPLADAISPIITFGDIVNDSVGGYAQGTFALLPRLRLTGGVRHTRDGKELVLRAFTGEVCGVPEELRDESGECQGTFDDSFSNTSFTGAIDYRLVEEPTRFLDDVLVYTSVTTGYRAGGQNLRGTSPETLTPFDPETLLQIEGGFKSQLLGNRVRLNAAGFHTFYDDVQRTVIVASDSFLPATVVSNAASAEISGAEIELSALPPIEGLVLGASFGLTLPKYNEFVDATGDRTDEKFDFVPEKSYTLSASYTRSVLDVPWMNRIDWSWRDEVPHAQGNLAYFRDQGFDIEPLATEPAMGFLNFRSNLTFAMGLEVSFFGRNLLDERTFDILALGGGPDFVTQLINNAGRELGVEAVVRF